MEKTTKEVCEWLKANWPSERKKRLVGVELEYPVVRQNGEPGDFREVLRGLARHGWTPVYDDVYTDSLLGAKAPDGRETTTDLGWATAEKIMPPRDLLRAKAEALAAEKFLAEITNRHDMILLGYGSQPIAKPSKGLRIQKARHEAIFNVLPNEALGATVTAATQAHIDCEFDEIVDALNVFQAFSGIFIRLFANNPVWGGDLDPDGRMAWRETVWDFAPERCGIRNRPFRDIEDYVEWMLKLQFLIAKVSGQYVNPDVTFGGWVESHPETWHEFWPLHEGSTWPDVRLRASYGTIELRVTCAQPQGEAYLVPALGLGIMENLEEAKGLMKSLSWDTWVNLRKQALAGSPHQDRGEKLLRVLEVGARGLCSCGLEGFELLEPLFRRAVSHRNPAVEAREVFLRDGMNGLIEHVRIRP